MKGEYYFRFKFQTNNSTIWMDLTNDDCRIPYYNNQIYVKATRISWPTSKKNKNFTFKLNSYSK